MLSAITALSLVGCGDTSSKREKHDDSEKSFFETSPVVSDSSSVSEESSVPKETVSDESVEPENNVPKINPFEGLEVQFDGVSPYVNISINNSKCEPRVQQYVTFKAEEKENFANGDKVKITAEYNVSDLTSIDFEIGVWEQEYEIGGMPEYVTDFSKIDTSTLDTEIQQYMDSHYMFEEHSKNVMENGSLHGKTYHGHIMGIILDTTFNEYCFGDDRNIFFDHFVSSDIVHRYQLIAKQNFFNDMDVKNYYYVEYINRYAIRDHHDDKGTYEYDEAPQYETGIAVFIPIKNVIVYPDGTLKYDLDIDHSGDISDETAYFNCISSKGDKYNINEIVQ